MRTISFTSSRVIPTDSRRIIDGVLDHLTEVECDDDTLYVTGACIGGDQYIASRLIENAPGARHFIFVPGNLSRVDLQWLKRMEGTPRVSLFAMPRDSSYAERNRALVQGGQRLIAFPLYAEHDRRSQRSGTWQTVRMARQQGIPTDAYILLPRAALV